MRGSLAGAVPTDPLLYRFVEILRVYGLPLKDVMQEKFNSDGIMSAIDFTMSIVRVPHPNGDRCKIKWNGKWLPYKQW
jgi:cyanate lyase